jgi:hypothetical protein
MSCSPLSFCQSKNFLMSPVRGHTSFYSRQNVLPNYFIPCGISLFILVLSLELIWIVSSKSRLVRFAFRRRRWLFGPFTRMILPVPVM